MYPAIVIMANAKSVICTLKQDSVIKKGICVIKLANEAPAPIATKSEGKAQQINVDEDAKSEKIFAVLSFK